MSGFPHSIEAALTTLRTAPGSDFSERLRALDESAERLHASEELGEARLAALLAQRWGGSLTLALAQAQLKPGMEAPATLTGWMRANELMHERLSTDSSISTGGLALLHAALSGAEEALSLRFTPAFAGTTEYPAPQFLPALMEIFRAEVLSSLGQIHPVLEGARLYQWLVSLHFFADANGRLARLAADWRLAQGGFPPLGFANEREGYVSVFESGCNFSSATAVEKTCLGLENTFRALLG